MSIEGGESIKSFGDQGTSDSRWEALRAYTPDQTGPDSDKPETPAGGSVTPEVSGDQNPSQNEMMARFMAGGVGETTELEDLAITATKDELRQKSEVPTPEASELDSREILQKELDEVIAKKEEARARLNEAAGVEAIVEIYQPEFTRLYGREREIRAKLAESASTEQPSETIEPVGKTEENSSQSILDQAVADKILHIDKKGRYVATDKEGEEILKAAAAKEAVKKVAPKSEEPRPVGWAGVEYTQAQGSTETVQPAEEPVFLRKFPEDLGQEAPDKTPEEVVTQESLIESRARKSEVFTALEQKITEAESIQQPPKKGILSIAYLWATGRRGELDEYRGKRKAYNEAQKTLKELNKRRDGWLKKETDILVESSKLETEISELTTKMLSGEASKKEEKELQKQIAKLVSQREAINSIYAREVAAYLEVPVGETSQKEWSGIDRFTDEFREIEQNAKREAVRILQEELIPPEVEEGAPEENKKSSFIDKLGIGVEGESSLRDLTPEAQKRFFSEEANGSLAELANARALLGSLKQEIDNRTKNGEIGREPTEMFQLYAALRVAKLGEKQAEAGVRLAIQRVAKSESLGEMKRQIVGGIKDKIGGKVFAVDSGFEIDADTSLSELVLNGDSDLAVAMATYWQGFNIARQAGQKVSSWAVGLRAGFNRKFAELIPESTNAAQKAASLTRTVANIEGNRSEVIDAIQEIHRIRSEAGDRRKAIVEAATVESERMTAEQRQKAVDSIVEGMIDMLNVPKQSKDKLRRMYSDETKGGLSDEFMDTLLEYYQRSKLNLERKKKAAEAELAEVLDRREWLTGIIEGGIEDGGLDLPLEDIERELATIDEQIDERILSIQDKIDVISRNFRGQVRNLEDRLDEELYRGILSQISS